MYCQENKKIGILGGSFDPVHNGHLQLAESAKKEYELDEVWFLPARYQPFKYREGQTGIKDRIAMLKLALEQKNDFSICLLEAESDRISYTFQTLEELTEKYKKFKFYFIMGADSFLSFHKWKNPERIASNAFLLAAVRDETDARQLKQQIQFLNSMFPVEAGLLKLKKIPVSSSEIRKKLALGKNWEQDLPKKVREYIIDKKLYSN